MNEDDPLVKDLYEFVDAWLKKYLESFNLTQDMQCIELHLVELANMTILYADVFVVVDDQWIRKTGCGTLLLEKFDAFAFTEIVANLKQYRNRIKTSNNTYIGIYPFRVMNKAHQEIIEGAKSEYKQFAEIGELVAYEFFKDTPHLFKTFMQLTPEI